MSATDPRRRSMIGKIKVAQKQLGLIDDDYRAILIRVAGVTSCADANVDQLEAIINELKRLGFVPLPPKSGRKAPIASSPSARKARALWISLYQLDAIATKDEKSLEAFGRRQLKVDRLAWADEAHMYKLIEALKNIGERNGWSQSVDDKLSPEIRLRQIKLNLAIAIMAKLKAQAIVPDGWTLGVVALRLLGIETETAPIFWGIERINRIVFGLSEKLHAAKH